MSRFAFLVVGTLIAVAASFRSFGGEVVDSIFSSSGARRAQKTYESELEKEQRAHTKKNIQLKTEYIVQLEVEKKAAAKRVDLDEAVRIRDEIARLQAGVKRKSRPDPREELEKALIGTTWKTTFPGDMKFHPLGLAAPSKPSKEEKWKWAAISGREVAVRYPNGWVNILEFDRDFSTFRFAEIGKPFSSKHTGRKIEKD